MKRQHYTRKNTRQLGGKGFRFRDYAFLVKEIAKEYTKEGDLNLASVKPCRINYIQFPILVSKSLHIWGCSAITDAQNSKYYENDRSEFYHLNQYSDIRTISFELFLYTCWKSNRKTTEINVISMFNNMDRDEYRVSGVNFIEDEREKELWQTAQMNLHPRVTLNINYLLLEIEDNNFLPASLLYPLYMKLVLKGNRQTIVHCCCGLGRTSWVIVSLEFLRNVKYKKLLLSILESHKRKSVKILKEKGLAFYELVKSFISCYATELLRIDSVFYKRMNILIYMIARKYCIRHVHIYNTTPDQHLCFISIPYEKVCNYVHDIYMPLE